MELMDKSLHQLYKLVYDQLKLTIPESIVGKMIEAVSLITFSHLRGEGDLYCSALMSDAWCYQTVKALHFLKTQLKVLHRGAKPRPFNIPTTPKPFCLS